MSTSNQDLVHRHSLDDKEWETIRNLIVYPKIGRPPENERRNINGILWILKTGAPWRDLPKEFGYWNTVYQRFNTFTFNGTIARIFEALVQMNYDIGEIELDFAAIDGTLVPRLGIRHKAAAGAPSKKKTNRKTMPSDAPEEGRRPKSSPLPTETSTAFP